MSKVNQLKKYIPDFLIIAGAFVFFMNHFEKEDIRIYGPNTPEWDIVLGLTILTAGIVFFIRLNILNK